MSCHDKQPGSHVLFHLFFRLCVCCCSLCSIAGFLECALSPFCSLFKRRKAETKKPNPGVVSSHENCPNRSQDQLPRFSFIECCLFCVCCTINKKRELPSLFSPWCRGGGYHGTRCAPQLLVSDFTHSIRSLLVPICARVTSCPVLWRDRHVLMSWKESFRWLAGKILCKVWNPLRDDVEDREREKQSSTTSSRGACRPCAG